MLKADDLKTVVPGLMSGGTAKTMNQAIDNGLRALGITEPELSEANRIMTDFIRDFTANKMNLVTFMAEEQNASGVEVLEATLKILDISSKTREG